MIFQVKIEPCLVKSDFTAKRTHRQTRTHFEKDTAIKKRVRKRKKFDNVKNRKENLKNNN